MLLQFPHVIHDTIRDWPPVVATKAALAVVADPTDLAQVQVQFQVAR